MTLLNETHDPKLRSWVASANRPNTDFPIQNLPFCVFRRLDSGEPWRGGVAIGDEIVDLAYAARVGACEGLAQSALHAASGPTLNQLMGMGPSAWSALRLALSRALRKGAAQAQAWEGSLLPQAEVEFRVPAQVGDYTDFYTSIHHARPFSVGINCALGARDMRPYLAELAGIADCFVSCYPNAGLPNAFGRPAFGWQLM